MSRKRKAGASQLIDRRPDVVPDLARHQEGASGYFFPQLAITRFLAVVWVVMFHYGVNNFPSSPNLQKFLSHGSLAVTFFFVLSGFTLAVRYWGRQIDPRRFMLARLVRIYPLYVLALVFFIVIYAISGTLHKKVTALMLNVVLMQAWVPSFPLSFNTPCWFLSVLLAFYIAFALFFDRFKRLSPTTVAVSVSLLWFGSFLLFVLLKRTVYAGESSASHDLIFYNPLMHLNSFAVGVGGGVLLCAKARPPYSVNQWGWLVVMASVTGLLPWLTIVDGSESLFHDGLLAPLFLIVIVGLALAPPWFARPLSNKTCLLLGNVSFGMYILQVPVMMVFWRLGMPRGEVSFLYLGTLLLVSALAFVFIEKPLAKWVQRTVPT